MKMDAGTEMKDVNKETDMEKIIPIMITIIMTDLIIESLKEETMRDSQEGDKITILEAKETTTICKKADNIVTTNSTPVKKTKENMNTEKDKMEAEVTETDKEEITEENTEKIIPEIPEIKETTSS